MSEASEASIAIQPLAIKRLTRIPVCVMRVRVYLTELGDADHEQNTVPTEHCHGAEVRVGPDKVGEMRQ